ncbi:MAG: GNAT family N-acetyltransferase [Pseudobutyrivibrio sp.]|nr:GNAT family N-acetyltransferase [Pseudobutyrivibrio sp.]
MIADFPENERKPLKMILASWEAGWYECLGLFRDEELVGYTYLVGLDGKYLIDYIAVFPEVRNLGLGSQLISLLNSYLGGSSVVIGEVENPDYTDDAAEAQLQHRRIGFYTRNGCRDTGLRVECFGVHYIILEAGDSHCGSLDETWKLYESFYSRFLPAEKVAKHLARD